MSYLRCDNQSPRKPRQKEIAILGLELWGCIPGWWTGGPIAMLVRSLAVLRPRPGIPPYTLMWAGAALVILCLQSTLSSKENLPDS